MGTLARQLLRRSSTARNGSTFNPLTIQLVWNKARVAAGFDPNARRLDACGAFIDRAKYGDAASKTGTGWEIDHILPVSRGGSDELANLQPLQWSNNREKGDSVFLVPSQYAAVVASRNG
jgi:hypothetical protein